MPQEEIDRLLVEHGRAGRRVVRLKGGDPFVFGRGGEEALRLREAGIEFEIVPGITAGVAAPAYAGIPVTHRELASGVAFVTGHEDPDKPGVRARLGRARALPGHARLLHGRARAAADRRAAAGRGTAGRRARRGDRARDAAGPADRARDARPTSPSAPRPSASARPRSRVVGPVAALREDLAWLERRPLHGRTVAVTRARAQASPLAARLRELGASVIEAPAIRTVSLPADLPDLGGYDRLVATSPNGVRELFARLLDSGRDARSLAGLHVAAMGPGTARAFGEHGIAPDIVPERSVAEGLVEALADVAARARPGRARARRARRAARRAARPRRRRRRARALRDACPSRSTPTRWRRSPAPTTSPSPRPRPSATCSRRRAGGAGRPAARLDRARHERRAARARPRARPRGRPAHARRAGGRGARRRGKLRRVPRPITFLSDYGLADEFVGVVHAVIAHECPTARVDRPLARRPAPVRARRRADARAGAALRAAGRAPRGRRPRGRRAAARVALRTARGRPAARRARQRPADPRRRALRRGRRGGRDLALAVAAGARVGDVPRPRPVRARRRPARGRRGAGATPARRSSRASSSRSSCRSRGRSDGAARRARDGRSTASATCSSTPRPGDLGGRLGPQGRRRQRRPQRRATCARSPTPSRASCCSTRTPRGCSRSPSTAARRPPSSAASRPATRSAWPPS